MGQYWLIAALRRHERWAEGAGKLSEWLCSRVPPRITALLIRPVGNPSQIYGEMVSELKPARSMPRDTGTVQLMDLPTEMHDKIFTHVSYYDIFSLCLTNKHFYLVGIRHLMIAVAQSIGPWAGEPIICLGDRAASLPRVLLDNDEVALQRLQMSGAMTMYRHASDAYGVVSAGSFLPWLFNHAKYDEIMREVYGDASTYFACLSSIHHNQRHFYPKHPWVLRNLTTKEFVHEERAKPLSLGDVVCSRICWSDRSATDSEYEGDIHRGVWAGHRFEIVGSEVMEREKDDDWRDVSESVMEELDAIWSSEWGPKWHDERVRWRTFSDCSDRDVCRYF